MCCNTTWPFSVCWFASGECIDQVWVPTNNMLVVIVLCFNCSGLGYSHSVSDSHHRLATLTYLTDLHQSQQICISPDITSIYFMDTGRSQTHLSVILTSGYHHLLCSDGNCYRVMARGVIKFKGFLLLPAMTMVLSGRNETKTFSTHSKIVTRKPPQP